MSNFSGEFIKIPRFAIMLIVRFFGLFQDSRIIFIQSILSFATVYHLETIHKLTFAILSQSTFEGGALDQ